MKVDKATDTRITMAVQSLDTTERRQQYLNKDFPRADAVRDLNMRYRWDLFWLAKKTLWQRDERLFAEGITDAHIDTVLRRAVAPLQSISEEEVTV